jgi:hypothetical protein
LSLKVYKYVQSSTLGAAHGRYGTFGCPLQLQHRYYNVLGGTQVSTRPELERL